MAQTKKDDVRNAILEATVSLLKEKGYVNTTMAHIARRAGISNANIYIYFASKLDLFFCVYEAWLREQIAELEERAGRATTPRETLRVLLNGLLRELPIEDEGFSANLVQAVSTAGPGEHNPQLVNWFKHRLGEMIKTALPHMQRNNAWRERFVTLLVTLFDGCVVNCHVNPVPCLDEKTIDRLVHMLLEQ